MVKLPTVSNEELKFLEKEIINSILEKTKKFSKTKHLRIISFSQLCGCLNGTEIVLIQKFLKLNPKNYGFKGKFFGIKKVPDDLVIIGEQYLPKPVFSAFKKMNKALMNEINRKLLIDSGYRSPAYQTIIFLYHLKLYELNFLKVIKRVAFPGYSEHGNQERQAIDFITVDGIPSNKKPSDFEKTEEFKWLIKNAEKFGFYLSYPKNNKDGIAYEPWHWHFRKKK